MENLQLYISEIDTIYTCLDRLETLWPNKDNLNFINNLKEYQEETINYKKNIEIELIKEMQVQKQRLEAE